MVETHGLGLLLNCINSHEELDKYLEYFNNITHNLKKYNITNTAEAYKNIEAYSYISKLIPTNSIVVDCECGCGLQQLFFANHRRYIGLDKYVSPMELVDNASFLLGTPQEILPYFIFPSEIPVYGICFNSDNKDIISSTLDKFILL